MRVFHLNMCTVQLAESLTGKPFSFVLTSPKIEEMYLRAQDEHKMVEWVSAIGVCAPQPLLPFFALVTPPTCFFFIYLIYYFIYGFILVTLHDGFGPVGH